MTIILFVDEYMKTMESKPLINIGKIMRVYLTPNIKIYVEYTVWCMLMMIIIT